MLKNPRNTTWLYRHKIEIQHVQTIQRFFIIDFEATCDKHADLKPMEIVEFPCLEIEAVGKNLRTNSEFHSFVKPVIHPVLTPFCTSLTGISQEAVQNQRVFPEVLKAFVDWMRPRYNALGPGKTTFVTCGTWDLMRMLPDQCRLCDLEVPPEMRRFINIKTAYFSATGYYPRSLADMFRHSELRKQGNLHRGFDDCLNIFTIMRYLASNGYIFQETDCSPDFNIGRTTKVDDSLNEEDV